jgi:hypothetical protein
MFLQPFSQGSRKDIFMNFGWCKSERCEVLFPSSLTLDQRKEVNDLLENVNGQIALRVVHPSTGIEESIEWDNQFLAPIGQHRISSTIW